MSFLNSLLDAAFGHPRGLAGRLGAAFMARFSEKRNAWVISLLDIQPDDQVLEVGFGPGVVIQALATKAPAGCVAGIDASPLMLRQASKRNAKAISKGQVHLQHGSADKLPFENALFDKALSINSVHLWPDSLAGVKEMYRVLKPGGLAALAIQPIWVRTEREALEYGATFMELLTQAGFQDINLEYKAMKPITTICVLGTKEEM